MPKKQPERRRTYIRNVDKAEGMAHEEEKEREEKKEEVRESVEKAVEGMDDTTQDALAPRKREAGDRILSEYGNLQKKKEELEEELGKIEQGPQAEYDKLGERDEGEPLRKKGTKAKKPASLKDNIKKIRKREEKKRNLEASLEEVNGKLELVEKDQELQQKITKTKQVQEKESEPVSGELLKEAEENAKRERKELGDLIFEKRRTGERKRDELRERLEEHDKNKPAIEGRKKEDVMGLRKEQRNWEKEREEIKKELEELTYKLENGDPFAILAIEKGSKEKEIREERAEATKKQEKKEEEGKETGDPEEKEEEKQAQEEKEKKEEQKEKKSGDGKGFFRSVWDFIKLLPYFFQAMGGRIFEWIAQLKKEDKEDKKK